MILVHGNWSEWSDWDECIDSRTSRNRSCSNPDLPTYCEGAEKDKTLCFMPTKGTQIRYSISNSHCFIKFNRYSNLQSALDLIFILKGQIGRMMQIKLAKLKNV